MQSLNCVDLIFSITRSLKSLKKAKKLILNKFNITETKYTLWSGNLRLNIFMFGRHSALFLSSASHAVDALAKGANTNRSFVSDQPNGQILRCLKSTPWARQDTGEVTCLQWEWIDLDTGGNRHRIRKTLRRLVPWAVRLWACASYGFARTEQQTMAAVV